MNLLLKLDVFKSLGFATKSSGIDFVNENIKLKKFINEKIKKLDIIRSDIIDEIKDEINIKYKDNKSIFLSKMKDVQNEKKIYKIDIKKKMLKKEMREEILMEIKNEEYNKKRNKIIKNYSKSVPNINDDNIVNMIKLRDLFYDIIERIDNGDIDEDEIIVINKAKDQVEKAMLVLSKTMKTLENY